MDLKNGMRNEGVGKELYKNKRKQQNTQKAKLWDFTVQETIVWFDLWGRE